MQHLEFTSKCNIYENIEQEKLSEARSNYAVAFLIYRDTQESQIAISLLDNAISLLDNALRLVPNFLDASLLREEIWHEYLTSLEGTVHKRPEYQYYLRSDAWEEKKKQVFERDGYRCVLCNAEATQCHHKHYENIGKELLSDLASMCESCHYATHERLREGKKKASNPAKPKTTQVDLDRVFEQEISINPEITAI